MLYKDQTTYFGKISDRGFERMGSECWGEGGGGGYDDDDDDDVTVRA